VALDMVQSTANGRYKVTVTSKRFETRSRGNEWNSLPIFWMKRAAEVLKHVPADKRRNGSVFGYRVMSLSDEAASNLAELTRQYYSNVSMVVDRDKAPTNSIWILNLQQFNSVDL